MTDNGASGVGDVLLPCPFCGGEPSITGGGYSTYGRMWWSVGCRECDIWLHDREEWTEDMKLDPAFPPKESFTRWNRRTPLDSSPVSNTGAERGPGSGSGDTPA